jgi:hypothetical protein
MKKINNKMENIETYENFLNEGKGISFAIYNDLKSYFTSTKSPNFEGAKDFIKTKKKNWNLTKEDFEEAKKEFKK